ncbi:MAG: NADPH:quinone reductase-like Zn-dependent oxidoreductase [Mariniblastus sp.]|jgi:NADPH:quinone reductase-like Zn-dependent oxidoreductase
MNSTFATEDTAISNSNNTDDGAGIGIRNPQWTEKKTMNAVFQDNYGSPADLKITEIPQPVPMENEVLVRVQAAGLHIGDCFGVRGAPLLMRAATGIFKPKYGVPGFDVSGTVEAVGKNVTRFKNGDEVFGECNGSCAEYVSTSEDKLALKPSNLSFEESAAVPTSALAALHALRDVAKIQAGQTILINGASGGVGTFAVQIAKSLGAEVTGVCSTKNVDIVRSIGADHVIDYTQDDFTQDGQQYDFIFDNVENRTLSDCRRALKPNGTLVLNSGTGAKGIGLMIRLFKPLALSPFVRQDLRRYLSVPNHKDLVVLKGLIESGEVTPVIDQRYTLSEVPAAIWDLEKGHTCGKKVVSIVEHDKH